MPGKETNDKVPLQPIRDPRSYEEASASLSLCFSFFSPIVNIYSIG